MDLDEIRKHISIDPNVCFGKPCVRGTRIWVGLVRDWLAAGWTIADLLENYPGLTEADVRACLGYAAEIASGHYLDIPVEPAA